LTSATDLFGLMAALFPGAMQSFMSSRMAYIMVHASLRASALMGGKYLNRKNTPQDSENQLKY
jgi:hypothetical protein